MTDPDSDTDPLLTVAQIAERLGISVATVQLLCRERRIPATKLGRHWFLPESRLPNLSPPPGLDLREMARRLGLGINAVRRLCQSGEIPAEKINGQWHITEQRWHALFTDTPPDAPGDAPTDSSAASVPDQPPALRADPSEGTR